MAYEDKSAAFKDADRKMSMLSDDVFDKVYDIIDKLPADEQRVLIEEYFGDFFEDYADWLEE